MQERKTERMKEDVKTLTISIALVNCVAGMPVGILILS
jgi:hypothetical protein